MATGESDSPDKFSDTDVCNCSICLEQFKTPKSLPCLHTFCEACLNTYIISSSKSGKTPPRHFNCPVCRTEVKPPDPSASVEKWASLMPMNHMINSLMETPEKSGKLTECDPCKFSGKIVSGEFWCFECQEFLCDRCKNEHTRNKFLRNHKLIPASDVTQQDTVIVTAEVEDPCTEHKGEILKVYCIDHQKMCCVLCLSINHRKCENIKTFDEMAENMKENGQVEQFSDKMKDMNSRVERISIGKRENITNIQKQQTTALDKAADLIQEAKAKLDKCHQEFKDKVSYLLKEQTTKLSEAADRIDNFQNSLTNCQQVWSAVIKSGSPKQIFVTFEKIRDRIETERKELEAYLKEDQIISLDIKVNNLVTGMTTLTSVAEVEVKVYPSGASLSMDMAGISYSSHTRVRVNMEPPCIDDIEPVKIWNVNDSGWFTGGTFLSDGRLLLLNYPSKTLNLYNDDGQKQISYGVSYEPWDAVQHTDDNIYVTSFSDIDIRVYTLSSNTSTFQEVKYIKTDMSLGGIYAINITPDNQILVERGSCIYIMTMDGKTKRTIKTSDYHGFIATSTSDTGSVLYYCDGTDVVCQSVSGNELMRYRISGIKGTRGIALDKWGNIYVCGKDSENVSVVSKDGKSSPILLSTIEGVRFPFKVGFDRSGSKFFVTGFGNGKVAVFKLNVKK